MKIVNYKDIIFELVSNYGYWGIGAGMLMEFTGLPFPGEMALGFAGFMVWRGVLAASPTFATALCFSWIGSLIAYMTGACLGRPFILKYGKYGGLNEKRMVLVENWFNDHRIIVLVFGRFISGVRPLSAYVAGMTGMRLVPFAVLSFLGTSLWCLTFLVIGLLLGVNWQRLGSYTIFIGAGFLVISLLIGFSFWWFRRNSRNNNNEKTQEKY